MNRTVESGVLRVSGALFEPIDMAAYWRAEGLCGCAHVPPGGVAAALAAGTRFISIDAASDPDLDAIAASGLASARRVLWAGSAGLASALARAVARGPHEEAGRAERYAAVLFCIGSDHAVTIEQQRELAAARPVVAVNAEMATPECIAEALHRGIHVALQIPYGRVAPERIRQLIGDWRGPLALSGGATASLVCRALGVREIRLHREIAPGTPRGGIAGGLFDGAPIVPKSRGGAEIALGAVADPQIAPLARWIVAGDGRILEIAGRSTGLPLANAAVHSVPALGDLGGFAFGRLQANCGRAALEYVRVATDLCLRGEARSEEDTSELQSPC